MLDAASSYIYLGHVTSRLISLTSNLITMMKQYEQNVGH
jgi:hypothetical protein